MKIEPFLMERMQSQWENRVPHNLSESGVHPMTVAELLEAADADQGGMAVDTPDDATRGAIGSVVGGAAGGAANRAVGGTVASLLATRLAYVQSNGSDALRASIAALYPDTSADEVVV